MPSVTFNVTNDNKSTQTYTMKVEDKKFINSIIDVKDNNLTTAQLQQLKDVAARSGDANILERCDLTPQDNIKLAELNGYGKYYEITLSSDRKFYQVKIKDTAKDPTVGTIKRDFGVRDNVFVQKSDIPYGNEALLRNAKKSSLDNYTDWDTAQLRPNNVINIPVEEVTIQNSPRGFLGRLLWQ